MADPLTMATSLSPTEFIGLLQPMILFLIAMTVYALFIFKFYKFIARRDIFHMNAKDGKIKKGRVFYFFKYIIMFPVIIFIWFLVFATLMIFLAKNQSIDTVLLISMTIVGSTRVLSYYNQELSTEVAKLIPIVLLGVFLVDISYFSFSYSISQIAQLPFMWKTIIYYVIFTVLLEFVLRILKYAIEEYRRRKLK